jgi:hypothetical protein
MEAQLAAAAGAAAQQVASTLVVPASGAVAGDIVRVLPRALADA